MLLCEDVEAAQRKTERQGLNVLSERYNRHVFAQQDYSEIRRVSPGSNFHPPWTSNLAATELGASGVGVMLSCWPMWSNKPEKRSSQIQLPRNELVFQMRRHDPATVSPRLAAANPIYHTLLSQLSCYFPIDVQLANRSSYNSYCSPQSFTIAIATWCVHLRDNLNT
jgi:hypothetical protein